MTRSTPDDEAFRRSVAGEFARARDRALRHGFSIEDFVRKLGVTRAGFHKYVSGKAIPSLRVLANARRYWGVRLSYGALGDAYVKTKRKDPRQTEFQFSIGEISKNQIEIRRVCPKGENAVEVLIKIDLSRPA
jgi:transcriptional regulator with XRE-family HTH domain